MKSRQLALLASLLLGTTMVVRGTPQAASAEGSVVRPSVEVRAAKSQYALGEVIALTVSIYNGSDSAIEFRTRPSVANGGVLIAIDDGTGRFRRYRGPLWGIEDALSTGFTLKAGEQYEATATVLWNYVPETSGLSTLARKTISDRQLVSPLAITKTGEARLVARLLHPTGSGVVESAPITVKITTPKGFDRDLWRTFVSHPDAAFFVQKGWFPQGLSDSRSRAAREALERVVASNPSHQRAVEIHEALEKLDSKSDPDRE